MAERNRAVIYVRESLDKWGDARAVDRFEEQCRQLCTARGLRLVRPPLRDNDVRASSGNKGDGFTEVKRMLAAGETDFVVIPVLDRFFRNLRDLEDIIDLCLKTGAVLVAANGEIDLGHDQGRLIARLLVSVAKAETERKGQRQREANAQRARKGTRPVDCQTPFGWDAAYEATGSGQRRVFVLNEAEADAIRWAVDYLLGGGSVSGVAREWDKRGLKPKQSLGKFTRTSVTVILRNPHIAGLSHLPRGDGELHGEIVGRGDWEEIVPEEKWRAVARLLTDPGRRPPRGARTLLGGLAQCRCGNVVAAAVNVRGDHVYRCRLDSRGDRPGPHVCVKAEGVAEYVEAAMVRFLRRKDAVAKLITPKPARRLAPLRKEARAIGENLAGLAEDRALGLISRKQMLAATEKGNARLAEIDLELQDAAREHVLTPFLTTDDALTTWESFDLNRQRAVIRAVTGVTLHPAGRGARSYDCTRKVEMPGARQRASVSEAA